MKKYLFFLMVIIVFSCEKNNTNFIASDLSSLEKKIENTNFDKREIDSQYVINSFGIYKDEMVEIISEIKKLKENPTNYNTKRKSLLISENDISEDVLLFLQSIDKMRGVIPLNNQYAMLDYYNDFLDKNYKNNENYKELKKTVLFLKWAIYEYVLKYDEGSLYKRQKWEPCAHRDCFDCCMYRKLKEKRNLVESVWLLISLPKSLAWYAASCIEDCSNKN